MNYAWISDDVVVNVSVGVPLGVTDAVALGNRPVAIGDAYTDGHFYRDGAEVLTVEEQLAQALAENADMQDALLLLGVNGSNG